MIEYVFLIGALIILLRAALGPTFADRILAASTVSVILVLLIVFFSVTIRPQFIDVALVIAMLNFVSGIIVAKYSVRRAQNV